MSNQTKDDQLSTQEEERIEQFERKLAQALRRILDEQSTAGSEDK
jgi:hypothetical protein